MDNPEGLKYVSSFEKTYECRGNKFSFLRNSKVRNFFKE